MNIFKSARAGIVAAIVAFSVFAGTATGYAFWSAQATATPGVAAATLSATATGWTATTLGNETISATGSNTLTTTGSITIQNTTNSTSTQTQTLTAAFTRSGGSTVLAGATTLTVWSVGSTAACTTSAIPTSPTTGTWSAGVTVTAQLLPNQTIVYCLRNTITDRQSASDGSGTLTFTPQVSAQLAEGNFTGGTTATSSISTQFVYPLASISQTYWYNVIRAGTNWCLDLSGDGTTSGTLLISYGCKNNTDLNQDFRFLDADGDGYLDIQPRHATGLRIAAAASTTSGSAVDMRTAAATTAVQEWQAQLVGASTYQFVNQNSGLCMSAPAASAANVTQVTCNGGADQKFTLAPRLALLSFGCTDIGGTGANRSVRYDWTTDYTTGNVTIQTRREGDTGAWSTLGTATGTTYSFASPIGTPFTSGAGGNWDVRAVNATNDVLGTDQITVTRSGFIFYSYYARCIP